ncbi:MAG: hypothetical protein QXW73_09445, partial [Nitrososphaerales archaeon]
MKQIPISVIEPELDLFQIKMKILPWHTSIMIQPDLSIAPKSFYPIDVRILSNILFPSMSNHLMLSYQ